MDKLSTRGQGWGSRPGAGPAHPPFEVLGSDVYILPRKIYLLKSNVALSGSFAVIKYTVSRITLEKRKMGINIASYI